MVTNSQCDFCHREKGLQVLITRKSMAHDYIEDILTDSEKSDIRFLDDNSEHFLESNSIKNYRENIVHFVENAIRNQREYEDAIKEYNEKIVKYGVDNPELIGAKPVKGVTISSRYAVANYKKAYGTESGHESFYYGLNTLREGYLYVYQKHLNRWEEYSITAEGFLRRIDKNNFFSNVALPADDLKPCNITVERATALTITIPQPEKADKVWFQYSEFPWTMDTKKKNKGRYRDFMQEFNVKQFLRSGKAENAVLMPNSIMLTRINHFSEFQTNPYDVGLEDQYLEYLTTGWINNDLEFLQKYLESSTDKDLKLKVGAMFAIDDPVGVAIDIGSTISGIQTYTDHYSDNEKTLNDIEILKSVVSRENDDEFLTDEERLEWTKINAMTGASESIAIANIFKSEEKILEEERDLKKALNRNAKLEWEREYLSCLNIGKYNLAKSTRSKHFEKKAKIIESLDQWLVNIWKSKSYINYWMYNYEKNHRIQGIQYLWGIVRVLLSSPNMPAILSYLSELTVTDVKEEDNCIMNAICLNDDGIKSAMKSSLSFSTVATMPWGDLLGRFNAYLQEINMPSIKASLYSGYNLLILKLNPVVEFIIQKRADLKKISSGGVSLIHPVSIGMAAIQNKRMYDLEIIYRHKNGFNIAIKDYFKKFHIETYGTAKGFSDNRILHLISKDPFWQSFYSVNEKKGTRTLIIPVIAASMQSTSVSADDFFKNITEENQQAALLKAERQQRIQMLANPVADAQWINDSKISLNKIALTGNLLLQSWAVLTMWNDSSLKNNAANPERTVKLAAGFAGVSMAAMEGVAYLLNKYVVSGAIESSKIINFSGWLSQLTDVNRYLWRGMGATLGIIFAGYDFYNGYKAYQDGETKYGAGMMVSGGLIGSSAIIFFVAGVSNPLGWVVLIVGIGVSIISNILRDNDVQKWLYRCMLGKVEDYTPFISYTEQTSEFNEKFLGMSNVS